MTGDQSVHNQPELSPVIEVDSRRALLLGMGGLAAGAILASSRQASAGPLNPPAGPVTSSGLTLQDVANRAALPAGIAEPRTPIGPSDSGLISQPGSYYLTGDRTAGLRITASDVTVDLCGFSVAVVVPAAIVIEADRVTVRNGRIRQFLPNAGDGVRVQFTAVSLPRQNLTLMNLDIQANGAAVRANAANASHFQNITWRSDSTITGSTGMVVGTSCTVLNCSGVGGVTGLLAGEDCLVAECRVSEARTGFDLQSRTLASRCVAQGGQTGFTLGQGAVMESCSASQATIEAVSALGNNRISQCSVYESPRGLALFNGGTRVERCKLSNVNIGIQSSGIDTIVDNSLNARFYRAGTGIALQGTVCHVDGNYIYGYDRGVTTTNGAPNCITRNRVLDCNLAIEGTGPLVAPVVGNIAGLVNPMANFTG